jgi:hypothetical protein
MKQADAQYDLDELVARLRSAIAHDYHGGLALLRADVLEAVLALLQPRDRKSLH